MLTLPLSAAHADLWRQTQHGQPITATINRRRSAQATAWAASAETASWTELQAAAEAQDLRYVLVYQSRALQSSSDRFLAHQLQTHGQRLATDNRWTVYSIW